jgi:hypothetical protein
MFGLKIISTKKLRALLLEAEDNGIVRGSILTGRIAQALKGSNPGDTVIISGRPTMEQKSKDVDELLRRAGFQP